MITIVVTTYNGEKYIRNQIDSLLRQTLAGLKILILDDNSTDKTIDILEEYVYSETSITLIKNKNQLGVVKNFEKGLSLVDTRYIALCDQDDIWFDNKLELELKLLQEHEKVGKPILVHSDLVMVDAQMNILHKSFFKYRGIKLMSNKSVNKLISHNGVMGCTCLFNKELIEYALPFPEKLNVHDYWLSLVNEVFGQRITFDRPLIYYRIHKENTSNSVEKILKKRGVFKSIFNDDNLPFVDIGREYILKDFLLRYPVEKEDLNIFKTFIDYLEGTRNPLFIIYNVIKYNIFRENIRYRLKIFLKILIR